MQKADTIRQNGRTGRWEEAELKLLVGDVIYRGTIVPRRERREEGGRT